MPLFPIHVAMPLNNNVTEFILLGLTQDHIRKKDSIYNVLIFVHGTLLGSLLIIATIRTNQALGTPMYIFLFYLSLSDLCLSTCPVPRDIVGSFLEENIISFSECIIQVFSTHLFGCLEIFTLILMPVDCYVAICKALHYTTITNCEVCEDLVAM